MRYRMLQHQRMEAALGAQQGDDLDFYRHAVDAQIRRLIGGLPSMNDEIANFDPQPERDGVQLTDLDPASGGFFERRDYAPADHSLKGSSGNVPSQQTQSDRTEEAEQSEQLPPSAALGRSGLTQGVWSPPPA